MCVLNIGCTEDKMKKYTSYVNVFQGNGEINLPKPDGIAASWYFIKAQCGNTFPHAALPFSKMTVGAYSGAYPTGYGVNDANYCGKVPKCTAKSASAASRTFIIPARVLSATTTTTHLRLRFTVSFRKPSP